MDEIFFELCGSDLWNANLTWYTEDPDLTPCFEKTILLWIPGIIMLLFLPFECCRINRSRAKHIPWSWLNISRIVVVMMQMAISVADLTYIAYHGNNYPAIIAAPIVQFFTFGTVLSLLLLHKSNGLRISYIMFFISLLLLVTETPQMYSYARAYFQSNIKNVTTTCMDVAVYFFTCAFFILQFFCDKQPLYSEYPIPERPSPKTSASVPSRLMFSWFTPMVLLGKKRPLTADDMYSLDYENSSRIIVQTFDKHWMNSVQKIQRPKVSFDKRSSKVGFYRTVRPQVSILPALFKTFGPYFLMGAFYKLVQDLVIFINPQLLKLVIEFVSSDESLWKGCLYVVLMVVASFLQMIFLNRYFMNMNFTAARINTALISAIYRKSLKLSNSARKQSTLGEIINLMAVDAASFREVMISLNLVWSAPLQIILALYFLWDLLGPAVLAGLAVMVLVIPINAFLVRQNRRLRIRQMKHKDERIKTMNEVLSGIKVLKLYAWEPSFEEKVGKIRQKEMDVLKTAAYYNSVSFFMFGMTPYMVALASFAVFVLSDEHNILNAEIAFVSLSLFNILRFPLSMMPQVLNNIVMTGVAIKRMNKFLNNKELDPNAVKHDSSQREQIVINNGTFSWDASDDSCVTLHDITLNVAPGALVAVVGSVGAGKSSLISAILGEMDKLSGTVSTKGSIAYVPQQAWIQNATLRKNITCFQEFDKSSFKRVVKACALEQDIEMLPGGDLTEIGEKGINLSGGQKQRISLARAVYSQADVFLLDDPLSAVDSHVGKHIFENVIGPKGVLRKKTRVLVTHGVTFLPETDLIVVMKNGKISESGTYKELIKNKGAFADFLLQYFEKEEVEPELEGIKEVLLSDASLRDRFNRAISVRSEISNHSDSLQRQSSRDSNGTKEIGSKTSLNKDIPEKPNNRKLMTTEDAETGNVRFSVFLFYLKSMGVVASLLAIAGSGLYQVLLAATNLWLSEWSSDPLTSVNGTQDHSRTHLYLSVYGALGIGQAVANVMGNISMTLGCLVAASWLHADLLQHILKAPMSYFDTTPLGRIVNRFSRDIDVLDSFLSFTLSSMLNLSIQMICTVSVITYSTPLFIVVIIPVMIFNFIMQRFFVATSRQLKRLESTTRSPIYSHFGETVQGASSIRAYGMQETFITDSEQKVDHNQMCNYPNMIAFRWLAIRLDLVGNLITFSAALLAVLYRGSIDPGLAGLSITYALQVTGSLNFLVRTSSDVESNMVSVERIKEYSQIKQEAAWSVEPKPDPAWPHRGHIEFRNFAIRYREGLDLVLDGISFTVQPAEKVGIVGRTGAGKSSLTLSLFRILESAGGSICIDNIDISKVGLHDLRSRLTVIPQDPVLFSGTLRANLDPFGTEPDHALWRALELANLQPFVTSLPAKLNHAITEGGENLSVGQKQLICLSRALLRKTKVLILDEATAAVDLETDDIIQRTIRTEFKDCTVLTIAHRLNTIMDYNRILVLDRGRVKEYDSPTSLIQNPNTIFHSMAKDAGIIS